MVKQNFTAPNLFSKRSRTALLIQTLGIFLKVRQEYINLGKISLNKSNINA